MSGLIQLANRFTSFSSDEIDILDMEFWDYRASPLEELPGFNNIELLITFGEQWLMLLLSPIRKSGVLHKFC